jgi:hypothetical protein
VRIGSLVTGARSFAAGGAMRKRGICRRIA